MFAAADEGGYVDPNKVEQILKVPNPKNSAASKDKKVIEEIITGPRRLIFTSRPIILSHKQFVCNVMLISTVLLLDGHDT